METKTIALLSQPNAGKSTLFNGLTGSHQHVGNWPGKTVEKKEGSFSIKKKSYKIVDLPGSYGMSANSDEEIITRNYIESDECELVCILADVSQLERSLFMLADYCGITKPVLLVLNMLDVAKEQGKTINADLVSKKLGIPVVSMSAANLNEYNGFYEAIEKALEEPKVLSSKKLSDMYEEKIGESYTKLVSLFSKNIKNTYSPVWLAAKIIENDEVAIRKAKSILNKDEIKEMNKIIYAEKAGNLLTGECKFKWIEDVIKGVVTTKNKGQKYKLGKFDKVATSRKWGKLIATGIILGGLILSFIPAMPFMAIGLAMPAFLGDIVQNGLVNIGASPWIISLVADALVSALGFCFAMVGFVLGISFVFGLLEEVGYMARVSYVFDSTMSKLGLQGKSVMPIIVSLGCNMGGAAGARVIDTWGQKTLTIAMAWAIPCAGCWGVVGLLTGTFFGSISPVIVLTIFLVALFHIWLTAKIFRKKLVPKETQAGLIMELPPYHKPKWGNLLRFVCSRFNQVFWKALKIVSLICIIIWALSYSPSGDVSNTILYKIGYKIEPVTQFIGLPWQLFIAWISSAMGKESTLGVLSALFGTGGSGIFISEAMNTVAGSNLGLVMQSAIAKPEALAFLFAFIFNIPCFITLGATQQEIHSWEWTLKITGYYMLSALIYAFLAYHIGLLIW